MQPSRKTEDGQTGHAKPILLHDGAVDVEIWTRWCPAVPFCQYLVAGDATLCFE